MEKIRITGSGISRSERTMVAKMPNKKASVIGEMRFSMRMLSIKDLSVE
jgi:hypothetical protein